MTSAKANAASDDAVVQPREGASIRPHTSEVSATKESDEAAQVQPRGGLVAALGHQEAARRAAPGSTIGRLTRKIQLQSACSISQPPVTGPIAIPMPENPDQMPIAFPRSWAGNVAVRIESVDGMMNAPPMPIRPRIAISSPAEPASAEPSRTETEDEQAERERALAAEAVAERAGGQQHAGEDEHVDVDDPLQLRRRSVEVALDRRQRDVEDRVVEADHEQRQAEDGERPPAAGVGRGVSKRDCSVS